MSDDNNNSESFDFDLGDFIADSNTSSPAESTGSSFDLNDDISAEFGDEVGLSADNPYFDSVSATDSSVEEGSESGEGGEVSPATDKKKGFLGGIFGGKKDKGAKKEKAPKEKKTKEKKLSLEKGKKKEKVVKEKKPVGELVPRDWESILCIAFSVFLLVSLLMVNIAGLLTAGGSMMQTLCFLGAFNLVGLVAAAVPILFYKFPKERTLPNVMLGIAAVAMSTSVQMAVIEFYRYSFIMTP